MRMGRDVSRQLGCGRRDCPPQYHLASLLGRLEAATQPLSLAPKSTGNVSLRRCANVARGGSHFCVQLRHLFSPLEAPPVNMDKLLHRGAYKVEDHGHHPTIQAAAPMVLPPIPADLPFKEKMYRRLGINDDFTKGDRFIYLFKIGFTLFFFGAFVIGTILGLTVGVSDESWIKWWGLYVFLTVFIGIIATIWFLIGGFRDLNDLIRTLKSVERDVSDDGSVRGSEHLQEDN